MERLIANIVNGQFGETDVDLLLIKLREFAGRHRIFREVADFVAHNDARDRGIFNETIEAITLSLRFLHDYSFKKQSLNLLEPFPSYIKKMLKYQADRCDASELRGMFRATPERMKSRIEKLLSEDKATRTCTLSKGAGTETLDAIRFLANAIRVTPAFESHQFHDELMEILNENHFKFDQTALSNQSKKISLCILTLLNGAKFNFDAMHSASCRIHCQNLSVMQSITIIDNNGRPLTTPTGESHGNLLLHGHVDFANDFGNTITWVFPVFDPHLAVSDWCDDSIYRRDVSEGGYVRRHADFSGTLGVNDAFRLYRVAE
ncbi:hypothetical protein C0Z18_27555 [Trinickia dabaoshanensis]|uniref:Uncharacterized protein n=1 Tax=Trinickia dabaoshanensis TaxID=564714 RepID=A0A2N7VE24_9BURK|nr:hypothetical protein [Trinickia dabaoshanensis]PMS15411.1 hypothetical protein C0Z18_27555 [Trinickia dabaoshanensis]